MIVDKGSNFVYGDEFSLTFQILIFWCQRTNSPTICSYLMFSTFLASLIFFGFVSFVFILGINFSRKKMVPINLNAIFPAKICCNFSYKNLYENLEIVGASVYSINFQIRQIPATIQHFS